MKIQHQFNLTALTIALVAAFGTSKADDALIAEYSKPDGLALIGFSLVNKDRPQLGKFDGQNEKGGSLILDLDIRNRDDADGFWKTLVLRNMGLNTREFEMGFEQQGDWGLSVGYNQIVSRNPNTYMTGTTGIGTNSLQYGTIGTTTATATAGLYPATTELHLGTQRDIASLGLMKTFGKELSFNVNVSQEDKHGTRHWGRGVNPEFAVEPIKAKTKQIDSVLNYTTESFQLSGGVNASWYDNAYQFVDTIGGSQTNVVASTTNAAGHTVLSTPLDNQAWTSFLHGGYNFSKSTRATFKASYSHATQHDTLTSITQALIASGAKGTSGYIPFTPGAPADLDGVVDTKLLELGLTSRPIKELSLLASVRHQDRSDKTPVQEFGRYYTYRCSNTGAGTTYYAGDLPTNANCGGANTVNTISAATEVENNPRDFKNTAAKLEGTYRFPDGYSLTAGWNYDKRERGYELVGGSYQGVVKMRGSNEESTWRLQLRKGLSETVSGSLAFSHSDRDGSTWLPAEGVANAAIPINFLNPVPFADRKRDKWRLVVDWMPTESASVQLNYESSKDKYGESKAGLKDGSSEVLSLDASLTLSPEWSITAWLSQDITKTRQVSYTYDSRTTPNATQSANWYCSSVPGVPVGAGCVTDLSWDMRLKDSGDSVGISLRGSPAKQWTVGADLQWTKTQSQYPSTSNVPEFRSLSGAVVTNLGRQGLPDIDTKLTRLAVFSQYAYNKSSSVQVDLIHERWESNDWSYSVWNTAGTALVPFTYMDGTQVLVNPDQKSTLFRIRYGYKFQ